MLVKQRVTFGRHQRQGNQIVAESKHNGIATVATMDVSTTPLYMEVREDNKVNYVMVTYKKQKVLKLLEDFICGLLDVNTVTQAQIFLLESFVVRQGWLNEKLTKLDFEPLLPIIDRFVKKEIDSKDMARLQKIFDLMSLSKTDARVHHFNGSSFFEPLKFIEDAKVRLARDVNLIGHTPEAIAHYREDDVDQPEDTTTD